MSRQLSIFCVLMAIVQWSFAETTLIQGNAFFYKGKEIELHQYQDLFTFKSFPLDSQRIGEDGNFKFQTEIDKKGLYLIKIGKVNAHLFIEPGDQYTLVLPEPLEMDRFNPAKDVFVQPEIFEANSTLNYNITKLEKDLNGFFIDNTTNSFNLRSAGNIRAIADSFSHVIDSTYSQIKDPYFQTYKHYRMAEFALATRHPKDFVYKSYFEKYPPAYDQLSFCHAFELMYADIMQPHSVYAFSDSLEIAIRSENIDMIERNLNTHPLLQEEEAVELLMAVGLYNLGNTNNYRLSSILNLVDSLKHRTTNPEVLNICNSVQAILLRLAPGTKAPNFVFADVVGNLYRLSEYETYVIYIQFFDEFNSESLRQMSLMKVLREGYGADIAMFSFSTSESLKRLREIPGKHDFDWFFGKIGSPDEVIEDYDLRAFPSYFFIDENLNFIMSPAPPPGAKIEKAFAKIWNEKHPNKMMPFKLQPPEISSSDSTQISEK